MNNIMDIIARETQVKSFKTFKYTFEGIDMPTFNYNSHRDITWEAYGEDTPPQEALSMKELADKIIDKKPIFSLFLDGSRHTFKVDDIAYKQEVFPVIAGQVGIGCCCRNNKDMKPYCFERRLVITLPIIINPNEWNKDVFFDNLRTKINKNNNIKITDIRPYSIKKGELDKLENKGIAVIQNLMIEHELSMVYKLVKARKVNYNNYLLKDGSLEYNVDSIRTTIEKQQFQKNFQFVVGVSKSFNPENCRDRYGKNNSNMIADLPLYCRTPVSLYRSSRLEGMRYAVWYVRIRDKKYTVNTFDGVLKIEKILISDNESDRVLETDEVNMITANIINERNPVCYGADFRWANHLYPIYLTETFVKSKYLSNRLFLSLF